jgi:hypothetical protein
VGTEAAHFGRDFVVLDAGGLFIRGLNPSGARAWELVDGALSIRQIAERMSPELGLAVPGLLQDLIPFFRQLFERQLLECDGVAR